MTGLSPELVELANSHGVATEFSDWQHGHRRISRETVVAVLAALGVDASTPERVSAALADHRQQWWRRMLPPSLVHRQRDLRHVYVHVHHGDPVDLWVECEDGSLRHDVRQEEHLIDARIMDGRAIGEAKFRLPDNLPLGWHTLHARSLDRSETATLVVVPDRLTLSPALAARRRWGLATQLYSVRSKRSWGIGDLSDLADLAVWSGEELGAGFVLVNPLHAAEPIPPMEPSPYLPTSRRFFNPIYIRVEEILEYGYLDARDRAAAERVRTQLRIDLEPASLIERDEVWDAKRQALELVYRVPRGPGRELAFRRFVEREGEGLTDFATWCVLAEEHGRDWRLWPTALRDPKSPVTAAVRASRAYRVDFYRWLQWVMDEQLAATQDACRAAGMPIGVMHDLAVGSHPGGADAWSLQDVFADGISVGAPPDAFNQQGQDWTQPPWRPDRLAETGYVAFRDLLRTVLRHCGALRVDHILGLFRLWWIPEGGSATEGTYVRYDHEALVGILALEAHRAGAIVVGEDLGTVEPWVRGYLRERGLLGTSILWFEVDEHGQPRPPEQWQELCLATVTTHDLPPTAGYLAGDHVRLRAELGLLSRPLAEVEAADEAGRSAWLKELSRLGLLPVDASEREIVEALHRFLARTPARLIAVSLPDAVGDRRSQNQPGTVDEYPNWRVPLAGPDGRSLTMEEVMASPRLHSLVRTMPA